MSTEPTDPDLAEAERGMRSIVECDRSAKLAGPGAAIAVIRDDVRRVMAEYDRRGRLLATGTNPANVQVGDVVLYVPACAGDRDECVHEPIHDRAAMVNHVEDGGVLGLTVFHRNGTPTLSGIRYSADRELGTWHFRGPADD